MRKTCLIEDNEPLDEQSASVDRNFSDGLLSNQFNICGVCGFRVNINAGIATGLALKTVICAIIR